MSERKNIDRLFQEKFKDFEANPPEIVWTNIEEALRKKKERRVIPLWFKLGGIAAALLIGMLLVNYLFFDRTTAEERIAGEADKPAQSVDPAEKTNPSPKVYPGGELPADMSDGLASGESASGQEGSAGEENKKDKSSDAPKLDPKKERRAGILISNPIKGGSVNDAVAESNDGSDSRSRSKKGPRRVKTVGTSPIEGDGEISVQNEGLVQNSANKKNRRENRKQSTSDNKNDLKDNNEFNNITEESQVAAGQQKGSEKILNVGNPVTSDQGTDKIADNATEKLDTTAIATVVPNALEELLKEKEKEAVTLNEQKVNRWQITSNVAPIYFSSTSNGSPIDSRFAENSKSYKTSLSYGAGFQYSFNRRISVRSGVNAVGLEYSTNDVVFSQTPAAHGLANINSNIQGSLLQIENPVNFDELTLDGRTNKRFEGKLNQRIGYIEVPVELSYKILDRKFGVEIIGGVSTLFLNENEISLETSGMEMPIGEANNLNDMHFSTNLGIGIKYNFLKSLQLKVEPILKYQINTFTNDAGNFKPYFFGIYSGLNYRF